MAPIVVAPPYIGRHSRARWACAVGVRMGPRSSTCWSIRRTGAAFTLSWTTATAAIGLVWVRGEKVNFVNTAETSNDSYEALVTILFSVLRIAAWTLLLISHVTSELARAQRPWLATGSAVQRNYKEATCCSSPSRICCALQFWDLPCY